MFFLGRLYKRNVRGFVAKRCFLRWHRLAPRDTYKKGRGQAMRSEASGPAVADRQRFFDNEKSFYGRAPRNPRRPAPSGPDVARVSATSAALNDVNTCNEAQRKRGSYAISDYWGRNDGQIPYDGRTANAGGCQESGRTYAGVHECGGRCICEQILQRHGCGAGPSEALREQPVR